MNVWFLTMVNINTLQDGDIYSDLMSEFVERGHNVTVFSADESGIARRSYVSDGAKCARVIKVPILSYQKSGTLQKGLSLVTLNNLFERAIEKTMSDERCDLLLYSTPPISFVSLIKKLKKKFNCVAYLMLKDIFPQNAVDLGMMSKSGFMYRYFRNQERRLYLVSDYIGCMSERNVRYILENNPDIDSTKVEVCPNSVSQLCKKTPPKEDFSYLHQQGKIVFVYGGNLGKPQGIPYMLKCFDAVKDQRIVFLIVGSGTESNSVENYARQNPEKMIYRNSINRYEYECLLEQCDVGLVFLDERFTIPNYPSRMLSYMRAGLPLLAATDDSTDVRELVEMNQIGFWNRIADPEAFAGNCSRLLDESLRCELGKTSQNVFLNNFTVNHTFSVIMNHVKERDHV